jgi:hypothetical protein
MKTIKATVDVIEAVEKRRQQCDMSKRKLGRDAKVSSMTYNAFLERTSAGSVGCLLKYLSALGLEMVIREKK